MRLLTAVSLVRVQQGEFFMEILGSMVKRLRHRPFTAVTRVRFPSESLEKYADVAQLAEQLICNQQVIGSSPIIGFLKWMGSRVAKGGRL